MEQNTELFDTCVSLMRAKSKGEIRKALRNIGKLCKYTSVPSEETKVKEVKDWTAEINWRFLR